VPSVEPRGTTDRRWLVLLFGALALATFLAYQPAWHGDLLWDDDGHITPQELRSTEGLRRIWTDVGATQQYYPVVHSAFWLMYRLWGDDPFGYHAVSIFLHALSAFLVVVILRRLAVPGAVLAGVVFALHPVHAESVAWITEIKNTLSGALYLAAALLYLRFDTERRPSWYVGSAALFALALLSKTVTATLPAALLVAFWWQRGKLEWRRDVVPLLPFFALGAAGGAVTAWVEHTYIGARGAEFEFSIVERCLIAGRAFWFYLTKLVAPVNLMFVYPRWEISQSVAWLYLFPAAALALLAACWRLRRRSRAPLAALLFFGGTLVPALGFVNVYPFRFSFVADHFQYLASLGIISLFAAAVAVATTRAGSAGRSIHVAAACILAVVLGTLTWRESRQYVDADTLYRSTIARNPAAWMAHHNLGVLKLYGPVSDLAEAMTHIETSLRINPDNAEAHNSLGFALQRLGRMDEALDSYRTARRLMPTLAAPHNNLGVVAQAQGRLDEAHALYSEAARLNPRDPEARRNLGIVLQELGRLDEAAVHLQRSLQLDPGSAKAHDSLGTVRLKQGQVEAAAAEYRAALGIDPGYAEARNNLAFSLQRLGRTDEAASEYREAIRLRPDSAKTRDNLGVLLFRTGRLDEAAVEFREAIRAQPDYGPAHYNLANVLQSQGRPAEAIASYRRALEFERSPLAAEIHNDLGVALATTGRIVEAREHFRQALEIRPDFADARANLQRTFGGRGG